MKKHGYSVARPLRIVLVTQDDRVYLPDALRYLISRLPDAATITGAVILPVSPFGKKSRFLMRAADIAKIFGIRFFMRYAVKYLRAHLVGRDLEHLFRQQDIPIMSLSRSVNHPDSLDAIRACKPDILLSVAGNEIFRKPLIELAPEGILNLHTALLPQYRGLMPTFWVLLNGEKQTGVSVFFVDEGVDSGPILVQKRIKIMGRSQEELIRDTKILGMEAICEAFEKIIRSQRECMPNDAADSTYYAFPKREDVRVFNATGARFF
jgi:methionyl-tRNA formyltransferase